MTEPTRNGADSPSLRAAFTAARVAAAAAAEQELAAASALCANSGGPQLGAGFLAEARSAVTGGKRLRALGALVGAAQHIGGCSRTAADLLLEAASEQVLRLAAALELYQASALTHDDIVDRADIRRGQPAPHIAFADQHAAAQMIGDSAHFGVAAAILLGDYLLSAADLAVSRLGLEAAPQRAVSERFAQMTSEVAYGQFLDLHITNVPFTTAAAAKQTAEAVVRLKSARYSVAHPVALGAAEAGADLAATVALERIMEPAGMAFQLRDDDIGVFGEATQTGKPVGSDLLERKRTVLLGLAAERATPAELTLLREFYSRTGQPLPAEAERVREILRMRARDAHEEAIAAYRRQALDLLAAADLPGPGKELCRFHIDQLTLRQH